MFKFKLSDFIDYPLHASAFIADFALLLFLPIIRPPVLVSMILVCLLVYLSMFFGAKFAVREQPAD